jgi:elongation factor 2
MGAFREPVEKITAGNIAALLGLESGRAGETLVDSAHKDVMAPFERIKYVSEPVITIAVEPKHPKDLPRLVDAMNRLSIEDPNLLTTINRETGEYLLMGMGELHLEIAVKFLRDYGGGLEIVTSKPLVIYRESVAGKGVIAMAKSPNKHNKFWVQVEPLEEEVIDLIDKGAVNEETGRKQAGNLWAVDEHRNVLMDMTKGVQCPQEAREMIIAGFRWACRAGPLCEEPLRGVKVKLMDVQLHGDSAYRGQAQIMPAVRRAILGSFLTAKPVLLEPVYRIDVSVPAQWIGECTNMIVRKRGRILASEHKGVLAMIAGYIPVAETLGLSAEMRSATSGRAFWQCSFDHWEKVPENIAAEVIRQIRERKGLPPETPTPDIFIDEA